MISLEVNSDVCDPYGTRPRRIRHDSGRHFDSNGVSERHLDIRGVLEILKKNENYDGGVNCAVCGKFSNGFKYRIHCGQNYNTCTCQFIQNIWKFEIGRKKKWG